ncbi:MAG: hypothetical protein QXI32_05525 [Candidatus Bathyarchaeia archaeon]
MDVVAWRKIAMSEMAISSIAVIIVGRNSSRFTGEWMEMPAKIKEG